MPFPPRRLRIATLNLWNVEGPYAERVALVRAELSRLDADIIGLQEAIESPVRGIRQAAELAADHGYHCVFAGEGPREGGLVGNAVLSRYPIVDHEARPLPHGDGELVRCAVRADLSLPEGALHFFSTHFSYRLDESWKREAQAFALDAFVREATTELPRIIVGDLNAEPDSTEIRFLTGKATVGGRSTYYQDTAAVVGAAEPTWARRNPFTAVQGEGDRRIDYVLVTHARPDRSGLVRSARLAFHQPSPSGVYPSDHFGLFAEVEIVAPKS
jgi:endonuclease/exonuclease/phosphatase family metal-dependent hydrolase